MSDKIEKTPPKPEQKPLPLKKGFVPSPPLTQKPPAQPRKD